MIEDISRINCLKGNQTAFFLTYRQVKERGFYDVQIGDEKGSISSDEFINREWNEKGKDKKECIRKTLTDILNTSEDMRTEIKSILNVL